MLEAPFPHDLIQLQRDWNRTYAALAANSHHVTELRRRLLSLSVRLFWHPYFEGAHSGGPAAQVELRRRVRVEESREAGR